MISRHRIVWLPLIRTGVICLPWYLAGREVLCGNRCQWSSHFRCVSSTQGWLGGNRYMWATQDMQPEENLTSTGEHVEAHVLYSTSRRR